MNQRTRDEYVLRLETAMDDAFGVRGGQALENFPHAAFPQKAHDLEGTDSGFAVQAGAIERKPQRAFNTSFSDFVTRRLM